MRAADSRLASAESAESAFWASFPVLWAGVWAVFWGDGGTGRPATGGASRARRARSAAVIRVSNWGPRAMGREYREFSKACFAKAKGVEYTLRPFSRGPNRSGR